MTKEHWLQLKVTMDALATDKKVSLLFESLKPGIDFSSPTMNTFGGILSQYKAVSSTRKKKKSVALCGHIYYLSQLDFLDNMLQVLHQHMLLHLIGLHYGDNFCP